MFAGELERIVQTGGDAPAAEDAQGARCATGAAAGEGASRPEGANPRPVITGVTKVQRGAVKVEGRTARVKSSGASPRAK